MSNQIGSDNRDHTIHLDLLLFHVHVFLKMSLQKEQQKEQQKKQQKET